MQEIIEIIEKDFHETVEIIETLEIIDLDAITATQEEVWERLQQAFGTEIIASDSEVQYLIERSFI